MVGLADKLRQDLATVGGGEEIADGLYSASLPCTALMNPRRKGGGLPRFLRISVLWVNLIG